MSFYNWIEDNQLDAGTNILSADNFNSDNQRKVGFAAGQPASAIRVNSALRQSTLVTKAIMDIVNDSNLTLLSSATNVATAIDNKFNNVATSSVAGKVKVGYTDTSNQFGVKIVNSGADAGKIYIQLNPIYKHTIVIDNCNLTGLKNATTCFEVINSSNTPITGSAQSLATIAGSYSASGIIQAGGTLFFHIIYLVINNSGSIKIYGVNDSATPAIVENTATSYGTLTDTVSKILY